MKALVLVMNVSWPDLWRIKIWLCSKWLKRKLSRFSWLFALSYTLQSTGKCSCELWECSLLKTASLTKLFLVPEMCGVWKNSAPQPQHHNGSSHQEVLTAAPASTDCWPFTEVVGEVLFQVTPKGWQRWGSSSKLGISKGVLGISAERAGWKHIQFLHLK